MEDDDVLKDLSNEGKNLSDTLYKSDKFGRAAKNLGLSTVGELNSLVKQIHDEMLSGDEINFVNTGANFDSETIEQLKQLPTHTATGDVSEAEIRNILIGDGKIKTGTNKTPNGSVNNVAVENNGTNSGVLENNISSPDKSGLATAVNNSGKGVKTSTSKGNVTPNNPVIGKKNIKTAVVIVENNDNNNQNNPQDTVKNGKNISVDDRKQQLQQKIDNTNITVANGVNAEIVNDQNGTDNAVGVDRGSKGEGKERIIATAVNFDYNSVQTNNGKGNNAQWSSVVKKAKANKTGVQTAVLTEVDVDTDAQTDSNGLLVVNNGIQTGAKKGSKNNNAEGMIAVGGMGMVITAEGVSADASGMGGASMDETNSVGNGGRWHFGKNNKNKKSTFDKVSNGIGKGVKSAKRINKIKGAAVTAGKKLQIMDAEGNVDAIGTTTNELQTDVKAVGNFAGRTSKKINKKINTRIMSRSVNSVNKKIKKTEQKVTKSLAKTSSKAVNKMIQIAVKAVSAMLQKLVALIASLGPVALIAIGAVVVVVCVLLIFGSTLDSDQLDSYIEYMSEVNTEFQEETLGYYNEGYKMSGTYNGIAYIDWKAALSTLQILQPDLDGSDAEFELLDKFIKDGVMYSITTTTVDEYVLSGSEDSSDVATVSSTAKDDSDSDDEEDDEDVVTTTIKYVVDVGTLDDYEEWLRNNEAYVRKFFKKEDIAYQSGSSSDDEDSDSSASEMYADDVEDWILEMITLYNSDDFDSMLSEAGVSLSSLDFESGTIFDTGESTGILKYPTTSRTITAGFPYYSSGASHTGVDFKCAENTPVCACADGVVIVAKELTYSYGKYLVIKHTGINNGQTLYTLYAHNNTLLVGVGDVVQQGQLIAYSGNTGNSTGPHCHLSVLDSWSPQNYVDPMDYLGEE